MVVQTKILDRRIEGCKGHRQWLDTGLRSWLEKFWIEDQIHIAEIFEGFQ